MVNLFQFHLSKSAKTTTTNNKHNNDKIQLQNAFYWFLWKLAEINIHKFTHLVKLIFTWVLKIRVKYKYRNAFAVLKISSLLLLAVRFWNRGHFSSILNRFLESIYISKEKSIKFYALRFSTNKYTNQQSINYFYNEKSKKKKIKGKRLKWR